MHRLAVVVLVTVFGAAGCVSVPTGESLREYTERVFRQQNRVTDELLWRLPEIEASNPELADRLLDAEQELLADCEPLNDLAIQYRDQGRANFGSQMFGAKAASDCEASTRELATLLDGSGSSVQR
ncbi:MAG: hypothetical protein V3U59_06405 [Gammaproteobacteria bacterium]